MNRNFYFGLMVAVVFAAQQAATASTIVKLIDEDFASGSASGTTWTSSASGVSNGQQWTWSPLSGETNVTTEVWTGAGGASARGLSTTYDHDQNVGTPNITIPGGFEVMSGFTSNGLPDSLQVATSLTLPTNLDDSIDGTLSFYTANRISGGFGGQGAQVSVRNISDARDILPLTSLASFTPNGNAGWNFRSLLLNFIAADAGDLIEVRFSEAITSGASSGARGLEIADVTLTAAVPEPVSIALWSVLGLAIAAFGSRRRFR